jgi:uncharacterized membrane protein YraQ (UPF0718 family)
MTRPSSVGAALVAAVAVAPASVLATAPRLGGGEELGVSLGRIVAALLICIVIAVLAILLWRQRSGKMDLKALFARFELRPRALDVVETRRLSPNADICLLRHDGREYLLLLMAGESRVLRETELPPEDSGDTEPS